MKYLKLYESFEDDSIIEDLKDIFSFLIHDVQIKQIPYSYYSKLKKDFNIYTIYGDSKNISDDREFLRELYGDHDILKNIYNKEYFYINLKKYPLIILYDYKSKYMDNYLGKLDYSIFRSSIPVKIFNVLIKPYTHELTPGIDYSDGSSGNLSLFPWIYEPNEDPMK